jgi:hypothetical protein
MPDFYVSDPSQASFVSDQIRETMQRNPAIG